MESDRPLFTIGETLRCTSVPTPDVLKLPFYGSVPKGLHSNLDFRLKLRKAASTDVGLQRDITEICRLDILFFINVMVWLYEPRSRVKRIPFVTWKHQDPFIAAIDTWLGSRDIGVEKSRGEGASWIFLIVFLHRWLFDMTGPSFGLVSSKEGKVDKTNDKSSLMGKLDFALSTLPKWMVSFYDKRLDRSTSNHTLINRKTNALIVGDSSTGGTFRGGRFTAIAMDEMAEFDAGSDYEIFDSTQHTTDCRIVVSTPFGDSGAFADIMSTPSSMLKLVLHWTENDRRKRGLYRLDPNENIVMIDRDYPPFPEGYETPKEYGYRVPSDGYQFAPKIRVNGSTRVWSPWYDIECTRPMATPQSIAQELDLDYGGSSYKFFGSAIEKARESISKPMHIGDLVWTTSDDVGTWIDLGSGRSKVWMELKNGRPPKHGQYYAVGCDVCMGTGGDYTSNSVLTVIDRRTVEVVFVFSSNSISPEDFARFSSAVCQWLEGDSNSVVLNWDARGAAGASFIKGLMSYTTWRKCFLRMVDVNRGGRRVKEQKYGNYNYDRVTLFGPLRDAILHGGLKIRSESILAECGEWEVKQGKIVHVKSERSTIESGRAHGDHTVSLAQAWVLCEEKKVPGSSEKPDVIPYGCFKWRLEQTKEAQNQRGGLQMAVW